MDTEHPLPIFVEGSPWTHWLAEIARLPSDSSCWAVVEDFLQGVRQLAGEKEKERVAAIRENLRKALEDLPGVYAAELKYFRFEPGTTWEVGLVAVADALASIEEVNQLAKLLIQVRELRARQCDTIEEDDQKQDALRGLRRSIAERYDAVARLLTPAVEPPPQGVVDPPISLPLPSSSLESAVHAVSESNGGPLGAPEHTEEQTADPLPNAATPPPQPFDPIPYESPECTDPEVAQVLLQARTQDHKEDAYRLLAEQQLRWLLKGENFRAYTAARSLEEYVSIGRPSNSPDAAQPIPTWLCRFAVLVSDSGDSRLEFDMAEFLPHLSGLGQGPELQQRFFLAWLCAGLLGDEAPRCIQAAQSSFSQRVFAAEWLKTSPFLRFCVMYIAEPAARGQRLHMGTRQAPESLRQQYQDALKAASEITTLGDYGNAAVGRYWWRLIGKEGPISALLNQARSGSFPKALPELHQLTSEIEGWTKVQSSYRNNIVERLSTFLDHLRRAALLHSALQSPIPTSPFPLRAEHIESVACDGDKLIEQLASVKCPSVVGYRTVTDRLRLLVAGN